MNWQEMNRIVKTKFHGDAEFLAYCTHCLNPMLSPAHEWESDKLVLEGYMPAIPREHMMGEILGRTIPDIFGEVDPDTLTRREDHECPECPIWEEGRVNPGTVLEVFTWPFGKKTVNCPNCLMPIHRGEGPLTAEGYRAELLRRLFPGTLEITPELFEGPAIEPTGTPMPPPAPLLVKIGRAYGSSEIYKRCAKL